MDPTPRIHFQKFSVVRVSLWGWIGAKCIGAKYLYYECENTFAKTDIPAITLIVYSCISVTYEKYNYISWIADIDDYSRWEVFWFARIYVRKRCIANEILKNTGLHSLRRNRPEISWRSSTSGKKGMLGAHVIKRVAAGAHLPSTSKWRIIGSKPSEQAEQTQLYTVQTHRGLESQPGCTRWIL